MSETKTPWTPGNWTVRETSSDGFCVGSDYDFPNSIGGSYRLYVAQFMKEPDAKLLAAAPAMAEALAAYERWEAELILSNDAWGEYGLAALPTIPQHLWDRLIEIQTMRNAALALSRGEKPE